MLRILTIIVVSFVLGLVFGLFVPGRGAVDYTDIDSLRADIRRDLQAESDRRVDGYRKRAETAETTADQLRGRVTELQAEIDGIVGAIDGSGAESGEIADAIGRTVESGVEVADGIGRAEDRIRRIRESLEQGEIGVGFTD